MQSRHPLQRLSSPARDLSALLHVSGLVSFAYSFRYLVLHPNVINESYGWHLQYLTIIGLSLSTVTFTAGLLADLTLSPTFFSIKNALGVISAPLEVLVSLLYWGLRVIDSRLVLPEWSPPLETFADLTFHLFPALLLASDSLFFSPPKTRVTVIPSLGISMVISILYWLWIEHCYLHNGFYPYPIFQHLDQTQRMGLFTFAGLLMSGAMLSLGGFYALLNGKEIPVAIGGKKKQ